MSIDPLNNNKSKYPATDDATKLADAAAKKVAGDDQKTTRDTYAAWQKQNSTIEDIKTAASFGWRFAKIGASLFAPGMPKPGNPWSYIKGGGAPGVVLKGALDLSKLSADVVKEAKQNGEKLGQVIHNEYSQITVNKYLLNQGLISKQQYDDAVKGMSPAGQQFAFGTSTLDERVEVFERIAKEQGANKAIEAELRMGKSAAIAAGVKTPGDLAPAMKNADFKAAYETNAAFRAGVDSMIDEYARNRPKYDKDVAELSPPPPPPVKG